MERIQQGASNLLTGNSRLPAGLLEVTRVKDANQQEPCQAVVQSVEFHPGGQLLMTAALDKHLRFFQVNSLCIPASIWPSTHDAFVTADQLILQEIIYIAS